jgi:glutamate receptor, ionotropic, invertebrate
MQNSSLWVKKVEEASGESANAFRTWNYPVREMYKILWESMRRGGGFLETPAEGIRRVYRKCHFDCLNKTDEIFQVLAHPDGSYAFIHDSSWVKYEVLQDCNLAEVGEVFGEQPVAMATSLLPSYEALNNNLSEA